MYSRCTSCKTDLGRNEVLEAFPIGRRVAFDPFKGRLWVLCPYCRTWNLAPLHERWEAVEALEREFEVALVGASTERVALARTRSGLTLVRVGRVDRTEFAGWRFGDRLVSRRRKFWRDMRWAGLSGLAMSGVGIAGFAVFGVPWALYFPLAGIAAGTTVDLTRATRWTRSPALRLASGDLISYYMAMRSRLIPSESEEGWALLIPNHSGEEVLATGPEAKKIVRMILPHSNFFGSNPDQVRRAVDTIERLGSTGDVFRYSAKRLQELGRPSFAAEPGSITVAPHEIQLGLEIAANEEMERRVLEGEAWALEQEWQEAEELAAIADDLLFPSHLAARLERWRKRREQRDLEGA
jgi:hypothetical protein